MILAVDDDEGILEVYRRIFAAQEKTKAFDVLGRGEEAGLLPPLECRAYDSPKKLLEDVRARRVAARGALSAVHRRCADAGAERGGDDPGSCARSTRRSKSSFARRIQGTVPLGVQGELGERIFFVRKPPITDEFTLMVHTLVGYWRDRQELRRKTAFLTRLLESVSDLVFMKDAKGLYTTCNSVFARFAGLVPEEIIGGHGLRFSSGREVPSLLGAGSRRDQSKGVPMTNREWVPHPDGGPVLARDGEVAGLFGERRVYRADRARAGYHRAGEGVISPIKRGGVGRRKWMRRRPSRAKPRSRVPGRRPW